jgi:hypothetical protein
MVLNRNPHASERIALMGSCKALQSDPTVECEVPEKDVQEYAVLDGAAA